MRAFDIFLNGKKLCTAGIGKRGSLSAYLTYKDEPRETTWIAVCGYAGETRRYLQWGEKDLETGDEILVKIVNRKSVDKWKSSYPNPSLKKQIATNKRLLREEAKRYGWQIIEGPKAKRSGTTRAR